MSDFLDPRQHGYIIEATFAGKATMDAIPSTIRVVATGAERMSQQQAKRTINSLWYFDGHEIHEEEWEDINITLVDIPFMEHEEVIELLHLNEIEYLWEYFCEQSRREDAHGLYRKASIVLGQARHVLYTEKARSRGGFNSTRQ